MRGGRVPPPSLGSPPDALTSVQQRRRHVVAAIIHSENSYVATLQRLVNVSDNLRPVNFNHQVQGATIASTKQQHRATLALQYADKGVPMINTVVTLVENAITPLRLNRLIFPCLVLFIIQGQVVTKRPH